jgi:hypothetical protein
VAANGEDGTVPLAYPELAALEDETDDGDASVDVAASISEDELGWIAEQVRASIPFPLVNFNDPILLEGLALNLYDRLRRMLRSELIVDRERSGVLTEFH